MRGTTRTILALGVMSCLAAPVSAQTSGLDRTLDRLGRMVERVMAKVEGAFNRGDYRAEWSQVAEGFEWSGRVPGDGVLEIKGVNGPVIVESVRGSEVTIRTEARGRRSDPSSVRIEMVEHEDGLTFCAVYPSPDDERENYCGPGSEGRMSTRRNDVQVTFYVGLPEGVPFFGRTVNGDIEALGLGSDVALITVNGDVDVSTSGSVEAQTVNGSIDAVMGSADIRDGASFKTVNGSITLDVPDDIDAELDASWLNGSLDSDLAMTLRGRIGRRSARGTLGDGGPRLEISTVNGSIRLR